MSIKYTEDHEWAKLENGEVTVGITDFAQEQLGEIVFVELPEVGQQITVGEEAAVVESVKAAGEVKCPVGGTVTAINEILADSPEKVNDDPMDTGWFYKLTINEGENLDSLLDEGEYKKFVESQE
ncbi:MAG: glycine cleavage system protein GcvH [Gammaproteobacteria bacterium]|nr:glycine cleavage system protein GcvH [Kiritimatiellia bacterium]NKB62071.1 glycine cleavage system protein GcvH [Gammaproteobacteria bacterium]